MSRRLRFEFRVERLYCCCLCIRVGIQAEDVNGFMDKVQRTVRVNCQVLGFTSAEFEQ